MDDLTIPGWQVVDLGSKRCGAIGLFLETRRARFGDGLARVVPSGCLCVDKDPAHAAHAERRGYEFWCVDVVEEEELPPAEYYLAWNFLEHLPSRDASKLVLGRMLEAAQTGVSLVLPSFEADEQLERAGLQFVWTRWTGHPSHFTVLDALEVVEMAGGWEPRVAPFGEVVSSENRLLMPRQDAGDRWWDRQQYETAMGPKKPVVFDPPIATRWAVDIKRAGHGRA